MFKNSAEAGLQRGAGRYGTARKNATGKKWDMASKKQRATWLKQTGSWPEDAGLTWLELMAQGGSQADVMKDFMERLGGKENADGPTDKAVQDLAWAKYRQKWDDLSSEQQDEIYKFLAAKENAGTPCSDCDHAPENHKGGKCVSDDDGSACPCPKYSRGVNNEDDDNPACEECGKHMSDSEVDTAVAAGVTSCAACRAKKGD